jgi:hypothetical protein
MHAILYSINLNFSKGKRKSFIFLWKPKSLKIIMVESLHFMIGGTKVWKFQAEFWPPIFFQRFMLAKAGKLNRETLNFIWSFKAASFELWNIETFMSVIWYQIHKIPLENFHSLQQIFSINAKLNSHFMY